MDDIAGSVQLDFQTVEIGFDHVGADHVCKEATGGGGQPKCEKVEALPRQPYSPSLLEVPLADSEGPLVLGDENDRGCRIVVIRVNAIL